MARATQQARSARRGTGMRLRQTSSRVQNVISPASTPRQAPTRTRRDDRDRSRQDELDCIDELQKLLKKR